MSEITDATEAPAWVERGQEDAKGVLSVTRRRGEWVGAEIGMYEDDGSAVLTGEAIKITKRQCWYLAWKLISATLGR